ncbi:hypothetical protein LK07_00560 [Streptomyces pluripotens]|uniref:Uncharacterized protein n=1 Tax=Streptomyces pluripotens TaxID=1355015 RepID=A0A221NS27_9ACTN|nr:hypothetical protein LK07_00560 [Streptomyces pluripotens]
MLPTLSEPPHPYHPHLEQPEHYQRFNRGHARLRAPGERAFVRLTSWRLLRRTRWRRHPAHSTH